MNSGREVFQAYVDELPLYQKVGNELPEYDYPVSTNFQQVSRFPEIGDCPAFVIKNTFIDTGVRQSSFSSCFGARQIKSCPTSNSFPPHDLDEEAYKIGRMPRRTVTIGSLTTATTVTTAAA